MMHNEVFCMPVPKRYERGEKIAAVFHQTSAAACPSNPHESCNSSTNKSIKKKKKHILICYAEQVDVFWSCYISKFQNA